MPTRSSSMTMALEGPGEPPRDDRGPRLYRVVVLGAGRVGKTTLIRRFFDGSGPTPTPTAPISIPIPGTTTLAVDWSVKGLVVGATRYRLQVADTVAVERYASANGHDPAHVGVWDGLLAAARAIVLLYTLSEPTSITRIAETAAALRDRVGRDVVWAIVENRMAHADHAPPTPTASATVEGLARELNARTFCTTAATGEGIEQLFRELCADIAAMDERMAEPAVASVAVEAPEEREPPIVSMTIATQTATEDSPQLSPIMADRGTQSESDVPVATTCAATQVTITHDTPVMMTSSETQCSDLLVTDAPSLVLSSEPETLEHISKAVDVPAPPASPPPPAEKTPSVPAQIRNGRLSWALLFGSPYEEEHPEATTSTRSNGASQAPTENKKSIRGTFARERHLDHETQVPLHNRAEKPVHQYRHKGIEQLRIYSNQSPLSEDGFSTTALRMCADKATELTNRCFLQLHALALDEPVPSKTTTAPGLFVTQWELDTLLHDLFPAGVRDDVASDPRSSRLDLHHPDYAFSLSTLLEVSWFLPFEDFIRLRSLVAQISRKHLSERKLALLNTAVRRQLLLYPHSMTLQRIILQLMNGLLVRMDDPHQVVDNQTLISDFLRAIHVPINEPQHQMSISTFFDWPPAILVDKLKLTSIICIQRVVFFRFFVRSLCSFRAANDHAAGLQSVPKPETDFNSKILAKRACIEKPKKKARSATKRSIARAKSQEKLNDTKTVNSPEDLVSDSSPVSDVAVQGSSSDEPPYFATEVEMISSHSHFSQLHRRLKTLLQEMLQRIPYVADDDGRSMDVSPTARAAFIAAVAFDESVETLSTTSTHPTPELQYRLEQLVDSLAAALSGQEKYPLLQDATEVVAHIPTSPHHAVLTRNSGQVDEIHSINFPPPYSTTGPSYWQFEPSIPTAPISPSKMKQPSPGVGSYNIERGNALTHPVGPSFSFSRPMSLSTSNAKVDGISKNSSSAMTPTRARAWQVESSSTSRKHHFRNHYIHAVSPLVEENENMSEIESTNAERSGISRQIQEVMRQQRIIAIDDIVQNLVSSQSYPANRTSDTQHKGRRRIRDPRHAVNDSHEASSNTHEIDQPSMPKNPVSGRGVSSRVVTGGHLSRSGAVTTPTPIKHPPKDYEPPAGDEHLKWAARVSEFYKSKMKTSPG